MKIVINRIYGGFGLSPIAEAAYLKRQGTEAFFYTSENFRAPYKRVSAEEAGKAFVFFTTLKDVGESPNEAAINANIFFGRDLERNDPNLVAVIEELGGAANGKFAELEVVEIPDEVEYEIEEYDGLEQIAEKHRIWG